MNFVSISYTTNIGPTRGGGGGVNALIDFYNNKYSIIPNLKVEFKDNKKPFTRIYDKFTKKKDGYGYYLNSFSKKIIRKYATEDILLCHDIDSAAGLAKYGRSYILVYHGQGSPVHEYKTFGKKKLTETDLHFVSKREKSAFINSSLVIFPSQGAMDSYLSTTKLDEVSKEIIKNKSHIIYNTCNEIEAGEKPKVLDEIKDKAINRKVILTVSSLNSAKGVDLIPEQLSKIPNFNERFLWILCGSKGNMSEDIQKKIKKYNIESGFFHIDYPLPQNQLAHLYISAHYYMMHHRISIFDLATLEAMSYGLIPILSPVGGNLEVNKNKNIIYFPVSDLNDNTEYLDQMSNLNKFIQEKHFGPKAFLENYKNIFELAKGIRQ